MIDMEGIEVLVAMIVTVVTQILKSPYIKIPFEKAPRITPFVLSFGATAFILFQQHKLYWANWKEVLVSTVTTFILSAVVYVVAFRSGSKST